MHSCASTPHSCAKHQYTVVQSRLHNLDITSNDMEKYLPNNILCANEACAMAEKCSRQMMYNEAIREQLTLHILNTSILDVTAEGCDYLHIPRLVTEAHGFRNMYGTVPRKMSKNLWQSFPHCGSRRQFYRMLSGEVALSPEHQQDIITFFASVNADTSLGFDRYEDVTV